MSELLLLANLSGHLEDRIWHASWSHDGEYVASCGEDKVVRIWSLQFIMTSAKNSCISTLEDAQERTLRCCEWSPDDSMIASASFDGTVVIWRCQGASKRSWDQFASLEGHENEVKSIAWSNTGCFLATCGRDKKIWIWELLNGDEFECVSVLEGHTQDVKFIRWHPENLILYSCSYDDTVRVWAEENDDWYCHETISGHKSTVWGVSPNHNASKLITCSDDKSVILWENDFSSNEGKFNKVASLENLHSFPIYSIDWNMHSSYIATGGGDNCITVLSAGGSHDTDHVSVLSSLLVVKEAHAGDVNCVRWNPASANSDLLVSTGDDGMVRLWRLQL